jgi:hypothetical protein
MTPLERRRRDSFLSLTAPPIKLENLRLSGTPFQILRNPVAPLALERGHAPFLTCKLA